MSNHSSFPDSEMLKSLLDENFGSEQKKQTMQRLLDSAAIGPTGNVPEGKLTKMDEGELQFRVGVKDDKVIVQFGAPVAWLGMTPEQAIDLGELLIQKAAQVGYMRPIKINV